MKLQNKTRHQQTKEPKCDNVHHFSFQHVSMLTSVTYLCLFRYLVRKQTFWTNVMFQQMKRKYLQILHFSIQAAQLPGSGDSPKIRIPPLGTLNLMEKHLIFQSGLKSNSLTLQQSCNMAKKSQVISTFSCCSEASNPASRHPQADHLFCALDPK